jgi:outer membrane biosynthesis protein TonB
LVGAVALHLAIIIAMLFTWTHRLDIVEESPPVVPVDLVTIAQKTNIAPTVRIEHKTMEPVPIQAPTTPPDLSTQTPPLPQMTEPAPSPTVKPTPPVTVPKTKPQPAQKDDSLEKLLHSVTATPQPTKGNVAPRAHAGAGAQNAMESDLQNALRSMIYRCWTPPSYAPNLSDIIVSYDLFLNPDGSVARSPQLDAKSQRAKDQGNTYTMAADSAATRAIYACAPYKLPPDRYAQWREINPFKFDPSDMTGQ